MDKLKMHSPDKVEQNIEMIGKLFPNAVTEVMRDGKVEHAIDFDVLRQELSHSIVEGREERYQFTWPDKRKSMLLANAPITDTLRPIREDSVGRDGTPGGFDSENLYIEGDNLAVLKLLQETYLGKIKMIYIDPPYNTGNDFVYNDVFAKSTSDYMEISGQFDEDGNRMVTNLESNGRFHTDWLNMMYPRLRLAKDLLADDGAIFISLDDNELQNLLKICDEIFGESNFVDAITWNKRVPKNDNKGIGNIHEYVLVYVKNASYKRQFTMEKDGLDDIYKLLSDCKLKHISIQ
ncbi:MAG: site-specific DNA-methyltransferase [Desulfovibrionaceae bacterium]|nr:site-specific DNA-methyltransferase [Desulfovibrionaceae bacterium]